MKHQSILQGLRSLAGAFLACATLAAAASAQRAEVIFHVQCSNVPGMEGQGKVDSPRKVEIEVEVPKEGGGTETKTVDAVILRDGTARLAATLIADQLNGEGTDPDEQCEIESTHPDAEDWVDREHEIKLTLPKGVTPKNTVVYKRDGKKWVTAENDCVGHLRATIVTSGTIGGMGRFELLRDMLEPFGLALVIAEPTDAGTVLFEHEGSYAEGTETSTALIELAGALADAGFGVALDGDSVWIVSGPYEKELDVAWGAWSEPTPYYEDDPEGPESYGEPTGWVGAGATFTPLLP